jgi:hypothetical protein
MSLLNRRVDRWGVATTTAAAATPFVHRKSESKSQTARELVATVLSSLV